MKKTVILLLLSFTLSAIGHAALAPFASLNIRQGLYNNQSRMIMELPNGQILVMTDGMMNLYDGHQFVPQEYDLKRIYNMRNHDGYFHWTDPEGRIWIKDQYHLFVYDTERRAMRYDVGQLLGGSGVDGPLKNFFMDAEKDAWLLTQQGELKRYDWKQPAQTVFRLDAKDLKGGVTITSLAELGQGKLLMAYNDGRIVVLDSQRGTAATDSTFFEGKGRRDFYFYHVHWDQNTLLVATHGQTPRLMRYDIGERSWKVVVNGLVDGMTFDRHGNFIAVGAHRLYRLDTELNESDMEVYSQLPLTDGRLFTDNYMEMLCDRQGGLWICTFNNGVLYQNPSQNKALTYVPRLPDASAATHAGAKLERQVRALTAIDNYRVAVCTPASVLSFDLLTKTFAHWGDVDISLNATTDSDGNVWVSAYDGLHRFAGGQHVRFDSRNLSAEPAGQTVSDMFRFCLQVSEGCFLVCNGLNHLCFFYPATRRLAPLTDLFPTLEQYRTMVSAVAYEGTDRVAVCTQNGFFFLNVREMKVEKCSAIEKFERFSIKFNCAYTDSRSRLWLGTQNGLLVVADDGAARRLTTADGLPNNCIQSVTEDRFHNLWVSTSSGVARIVTGMETTVRSITAFDESDGVQADEFLERAALTSSDGMLMFGGLGGITMFSPETFQYPKEAFMPILVGVKLFDMCTSPAQNEITCNHDENFLTFEFSALNYSNPTHTHYRYRLRGVDDKWNHSFNPSGNGEAHYTKLLPGEYVFEVQAAVADGDWSEPLLLPVHIRPPFWQTWWAYLLYIIIGIAVAVTLLNMYVGSKRRRIMSEAERREREYKAEVDEMRRDFFRNIKRDFHTPLKTITLEDDISRVHKAAADMLAIIEDQMDIQRENNRTLVDNIVSDQEKTIRVESADEQMLRKIVAFIEKNIDDADYGVERLSSDVGMDRSNLYRKVHDVLGQTPKDLIRSMRLKRAAFLLETTGMNINEVAFKVGFGTSRSFRMSFKDHFGMLPSEYQRLHGKDVADDIPEADTAEGEA